MKPSHEIRLICKELSNGKWFDVGLVRRASACVIGGGWAADLPSGSKCTPLSVMTYPYGGSPQNTADTWAVKGYTIAQLIDGLVKYRFVR